MASLKTIAALTNRLGCEPRIKLKYDATPEAWSSKGIFLPVRGCIEVQGPWPFREVEWLEMNPIVVENIGRLVKPRQHDYLNDIVALLQSEEIPYSIIEGMVRVPFKVFE